MSNEILIGVISDLEKEIASLKDRLADQVVQVLAYKVLVSELDEEIASLKEQLKRALERH